MRHPPSSLSRARSMRRTQRSSQRSAVSADSKLTSQTGDSGVVSQVSQGVTPVVDTDHSRTEDTPQQRSGSKKSTSLVVDLSPPPIVTVDTPDNNTVTITNGAAPSLVSNGSADKERMSARDRSAGACLQIRSICISPQVGARQGNHQRRDRVSEVRRISGLRRSD